MAAAQAQKFRPPKSTIKPRSDADQRSSTSTSSSTRPPVNATDSLAAMKSFLHMSVGSLLYLRGLLPVECFEDNTIGKFRVELSPTEGEANSQVVREDKTVAKVLRKGHTEQADYLREVIDSNIMAAISAGYLKSLMILVILDENRSEDITESYTLNFFYHQKGQVQIGVDVPGKSKSEAFNRLGAPCTGDELRYQMKYLLRTIVMACRDLDDLPQRRFLDFKLFLAEDTPKDYTLPHMRPVEDKLLMSTQSLASAPLFLGRGQAAQTGHHGVSFRLTTIIQSMYRRQPSPTPELDTAMDQDAYRRKRAREELEDLEEDKKKRRVVWDPETGINDRMDLDPSSIDPLNDLDPRLGSASDLDTKSLSTLRQPLGWLLPNGNLQEILVGRFPWAENEGDPQPSLGVIGRNLLRDAALNPPARPRNRRYIPGWTQITQVTRSDSHEAPSQNLSNSQNASSQSASLEPIVLSTFTRTNYTPVASAGRKKIPLFLPASMEDDDVEMTPPKKKPSPSKSRRTKVCLKPARPPQMADKPLEDEATATPASLATITEERMTTTANTVPTVQNNTSATTKASKATKTKSSKNQVAPSRSKGTALPPARKAAAKGKAKAPAPTPILTLKPLVDWIDCYCQARDESDHMAVCMDCARPMHLSCAGYLKKDLLPENFVCLNCIYKNVASQLDPDKREADLRNLALFRRALSFIRSVGSLQSYDHLNHELVTEGTGCEDLVKRITDEGFISKPGKGIRQFPRKWNNTPSQNERLQAYFEPGGHIERQLFGLGATSSQNIVMPHSHPDQPDRTPSDDGRPGMDVDSMETQQQQQAEQAEQDLENVNQGMEFNPAPLLVPMRRCHNLIDLTWS